jgi:phage pi2 protein 07
VININQSLEVTLTIPIPADMVLIKKVEYAELKEKTEEGKWWRIENVLEHTTMKRDWVDKNILKKPKWRKILDSENGGCCIYPNTTEPYVFIADDMKKFLKKYFQDIFKDII